MGAVIDASALIAFLRDEPGAEAVEKVLRASQTCYAHALNLCEVYCDYWRGSDQSTAEAAVTDLIGLGIVERPDMDSEFWRDVGRLKAVHRKARGLLRLNTRKEAWRQSRLGRSARLRTSGCSRHLPNRIHSLMCDPHSPSHSYAWQQHRSGPGRPVTQAAMFS